MPNESNNPSSSGSNEISELMRDVGNAVNMNYSCDGSTAYTSTIVPAVENVFGYASSADLNGYDRNEIKDEIYFDRPVILRGDDGGGTGHAWVADGYRDIFTYSSDCSHGWGYLLFHMNWGWENNSNFNGWYSFDDFTPGSRNYNQNKQQIVGIKP